MLTRFWIIWVSYWLIFIIQPVESIYGEVNHAFSIQFLFATCFSIAYKLIPGKLFKSKKCRPLFSNPKTSKKYLRFCIYLSMIGLFALIIDKVAIQGIDFSQGFSVAREQWKTYGEERDGSISSIFSVLGYLLGNSYFLAIILLMKRSVSIPNATRIKFFFVAFTISLINGLITGGRSNIFLMIAFMVSSYFSDGRLPSGKLFNKIQYRITIRILITILLIYLLLVFVWRSQASDQHIVLYANHILTFLGLTQDKWFEDFCSNSPIIGPILAVINLGVSYLTHSLSTTVKLLSSPVEDKVIIFNYFYSLLSRIGVEISVDTDWILVGRFPSLPGAVYYQYSFLGTCLFAIVLGYLAKISYILMRNNKGNYLTFFLSHFIEVISLLSPFLCAVDILSYPFAFIGIFICWPAVYNSKEKAISSVH